MKRFFARMWSGWKKFAFAFARIQLEIILFLFYYLIFTPFGLILKLLRHDPLHVRLKDGSTWEKTDIGKFNSERARHQS